MQVDAIVNAANTSLKAGGGVCGAIFNAAGVDKLQKACDRLAPIKMGEAVITKGFALSAKYVIHTAGPVYHDGSHGEEALLRSCYINALNIAKKRGCKSIAFPLISSGIYGYPKDEALNIATGAISEWLATNDMDASLVVFDKTAFALSQELLGEVKAFIGENYVDEREYRRRRRELSESLSDFSVFMPEPKSIEECEQTEALATDPKKEFDGVTFSKTPFDQKTLTIAPQSAQKSPAISHKIKGLENLDEPFSATLLRLIDVKGKTDVEIYKRANLDRKLFSKIRTGKGYMPSKKTIIALAVALELSLIETRDLLERAGFALSRSVVFDVIIEYFITRKRYDVFEINNVLFEYDQQILGG